MTFQRIYDLFNRTSRYSISGYPHKTVHGFGASNPPNNAQRRQSQRPLQISPGYVKSNDEALIDDSRPDSFSHIRILYVETVRFDLHENLLANLTIVIRETACFLTDKSSPHMNVSGERILSDYQESI